MKTVISPGVFWRITGIVLMFLTCGCETSVPEPRRGNAVTAPCPVETSGKAADLPQLIEAPRKWIDQHDVLLRKAMRAADVAPLWCGTSIGDAYRVTVIPASRPLIVAEATVGNGAEKTHVVTFVDPRTSDENRTLERFERVAQARHGDLERGMAASIERHASAFWTMPAFRENVDAMDGYIWIIEARRQGAYRMVIRDNVRDASFETLAITILRATKVAIDEETVGDLARSNEKAP